MPITLAQAQVNTQNAIDYSVIDNLRRYSWLWDNMPFDDSVNPGTGGGTLTYGYTRLITAAPAQFRQYNQEYTPGQASRLRYTVDLKPFGGAFTLDRVLANLGSAATNELTFQMQQLITSAPIRLQQEMILGDTAVDGSGFDGLSKALVGSTTEKTAGYVAGSADWTPTSVNTQIAANIRLDELDDLLSLVVPSHTGGGNAGMSGGVPPGTKAILSNTKGIARVKSVARWASMYTSEKDDLGRQIQRYGDWVLIDLGDRFDGSSPIVPIAAGTGLTDIYAATLGLDAFHGVSMMGKPVVQTWLPDWNNSGAVKSGEIEIGPLAVVLKNTKSAAVLRGVKVQ
jgi:hypothetical protein